MGTIMTAALLAATLLPGAAIAQSRGDLYRDRQEIREEQRDLDRAYARGDWRDVRHQRADLRDARRDYRDDLRDRRAWHRDDWRSWRDGHRTLYGRGGWRAPFRYQAFRPGVPIAAPFYGPRYIIADPGVYHLPAAPRYARWVRHYDDVLLVDQRRGVVIDVIRNFYW